jgi:hypothetical protein
VSYPTIAIASTVAASSLRKRRGVAECPLLLSRQFAATRIERGGDAKVEIGRTCVRLLSRVTATIQ